MRKTRHYPRKNQTDLIVVKWSCTEHTQKQNRREKEATRTDGSRVSKKFFSYV